MKAEKSIIKNYLYNLSYQLLSIILPIVTVPYISRVLRPVGVGLNSYTYAIVTYVIVLGGLGFTLHGNRVISIARNDMQALKANFWSIFILKCMTMSIALIAYLLWILISKPSNQLLYILQAIAIIATFFDITFFLNGLEEFKKTVGRNFLIRIVSFILMFIFVKKPSDLFIYIIIMQGSLLIGNLSLIPYLKKYHIFEDLSAAFFKTLEFKKHIVPSIQLFIPIISIQVYTVLNKLMLGYFKNSTEVGFYDNGMKIVTLILTVLTSLGTIMLPRASYYFSTGNFDKIKTQFNTSIQLTLVIAIGFVAGIMGVSGNFVILFFGPGFEKITTILPILSLAIIPISLASITMTQFLVPSGRNRAYTISVISGAIVNVLLNILLIPKLSAIGAALSYVISESIVTILQLISSRSILFKRENLRNVVLCLFSALIMYAAVTQIPHYLTFTHGVLLLFIQVILGAAIYCMILIMFKNGPILYILSKVLSIVKVKVFKKN